MIYHRSMIKNTIVALTIGILALLSAVFSTGSSAARDASGDYVAWAVGDMCERQAAAECATVAKLIDDDTTKDAFLELGDAQYEAGTLAEYNTYYKPKVDALLGAITHPASGNHDYHTTAAAGYFDFFGSRAGTQGQGWYSFALGNWRIISANSNCANVGGCGPTSPQGKFIKAELAKPETCEIVYAHHEFMSDANHGDTAPGKQLFTATYNGHGELYLAGHDHNYQRFAARKPDKTLSSTGTVSIVAGTGGANSYAFKATDRSVYRQATDFGALQLTLGQTSYTGKFINTAGKVMDTFSGTCH